jgi:cytochrome c
MLRPAVFLLAAGLFAPAAQAQDAEAGAKVFAQCRACHSIAAGGRAGVGPNLFGIVGRKAGEAEGFRYSANLKERAAAGLTWDEPTLRAYLANPKAVLPQGAMSYVGLKNEQQLTDLLAYLAAQK